MSDDPARALLRHTVATLAYRARKAVHGASPEFRDFRVAPGTRSAGEILAHIGDLFDWALWMAKGKHVWHSATPLAWNAEVERFFASLGAFDAYLAGDAPLEFSAEQLFQGPIADALTHVGQIALVRRLAGAPVRAENYVKAEIVIGRVGAVQAAPRVEFD